MITKVYGILLIAVVLYLNSCATGSSSRNPDAEKGTSPALLLTTVANRFLEMEPCGCEYSAKGGGTREFNLYTKLRAEFPNHKAISTGTTFIPGDFDFKKKKVTKDLKKVWDKKGEYMVAMLQKLSFAAIGVTAEDLAAGGAPVLEAAAKNTIPLISSNLYSKKSKKPLFQTSIDLVTPTGKALVVAVSAPKERISSYNKDVEVRDFKKELTTLLKGKQDQYEFIIVLTNYQTDKDFEAIATVTSIPTMILGGAPEDSIFNMNQFNSWKTVQFNPYARGRSIMSLAIEKKGAATTWISRQDLATQAEYIALLGKKLARAKTDAEKADANRNLKQAQSELVKEGAPGLWVAPSNIGLDETYELPRNSVSALVDEVKVEVKKCALEALKKPAIK